MLMLKKNFEQKFLFALDYKNNDIILLDIAMLADSVHARISEVRPGSNIRRWKTSLITVTMR